MPLSQGFFDDLADIVTETLGVGAETGEGKFETLIYIHRETLSAEPTTYPDKRGLVTQYSEKILTENLALSSEGTRVQRDDRQLRIATSLVTWAPMLSDSVERADGSVWRVMDLAGGVGRPFWRMRIRKIG